ncbi:MAG: hypothetical protein AB1567_00390, partial [bacterium]
ENNNLKPNCTGGKFFLDSIGKYKIRVEILISFLEDKSSTLLKLSSFSKIFLDYLCFVWYYLNER